VAVIDLGQANLAATAATEQLGAAEMVGVRFLQEVAPPRPGAVPAREVAAGRNRIVAFVAAACDLAAVVAAYEVAGAVQSNIKVAGDVVRGVPGAIWLTLPIWLGIFALYGLYDRARLAAPSEEARRLFHAITVGAVTLVTATFLLKIPVSRTWIGVVSIASLAAVGLARIVLRKVVHALNARGLLGTRTLVVGMNDEARTIARTLNRQLWLGYRPAGFVTVGGDHLPQLDGLDVIGSVEDIAGAVERAGAGAVIVAGSAIRADTLGSLYRELQALDVEVRVSAGLPQIAASRVTVEPLDGLAVLSLRHNELTRQQTTLKRVFDVMGATLLLVAAAPVMVLVALIVRLTSRGPVIFRQTRAGEGGRAFRILKFRTMVVDAEDRLTDLIHLNEADGLLFKISCDPRITRVGRMLRRWGLDELPQLWNVLRGDMSLVGPRPPIPEETARYDEWIQGRLRVKPGITGLWQVNGRHALSFADYVRYDLFYVENWSLTLDLFIVLRTVPALLRRRGAY
jgi:exopolysaccharide biosynthesis polyprenyl glycosylphosphotransferase